MTVAPVTTHPRVPSDVLPHRTNRVVLVEPGSALDAGPASLVQDSEHSLLLLREGETVTADLVDLINRLLLAA